jgi:hypothetical protein
MRRLLGLRGPGALDIGCAAFVSWDYATRILLVAALLQIEALLLDCAFAEELIISYARVPCCTYGADSSAGVVLNRPLIWGTFHEENYCSCRDTGS